MTVRPLRTMVCATAGATMRSIERLLSESKTFELVARASASTDLEHRCRTVAPDILILDEALGDATVRRLARILALERPLPILLVVDEELPLSPDEDDTWRRLRVCRIGRHRLVSADPIDRMNARTRLRLLATRTMEPRRTAPPDVLAAVVDELRREEPGAHPTRSVEALARLPLDVVILLASPSHTAVVTRLLEGLSATRIPLLVLAHDITLHDTIVQTAREGGTRVHEPATSVALRRATGLVIPPAFARTRLDGDVIRIEPHRRADPIDLVESVPTASEQVLMISASDDSSLQRSLRRAEVSGQRVAHLGARTNGSWTSDDVVSVEDLSWLLRNVWPHRV